MLTGALVNGGQLSIVAVVPQKPSTLFFFFLFLSFFLFFNLFSFKSGLFCLVSLILLYWLASEAWDPVDSYLPRVGMTCVCSTSSGFYLGARDGAHTWTTTL